MGRFLGTSNNLPGQITRWGGGSLDPCLGVGLRLRVWNADPAWDKKCPKKATLFRTSPSLLGPCLGNMINTLIFLETGKHLRSRIAERYSRGWENSRKLCKPSTSSPVCIPVSNSPNPLVFISGYANTEKSFLMLKWLTTVRNQSKWDNAYTQGFILQNYIFFGHGA